ncbi:unnamed protein product [Arctogadus glacialis]
MDSDPPPDPPQPLISRGHQEALMTPQGGGMAPTAAGLQPYPEDLPQLPPTSPPSLEPPRVDLCLHPLATGRGIWRGADSSGARWPESR